MTGRHRRPRASGINHLAVALVVAAGWLVPPEHADRCEFVPATDRLGARLVCA